MGDIRTFPEANAVLKAPPGAKHVRDLPVFADGKQLISCWQLSEEEVDTFIRTGIIWLYVMGSTHPPVYVSAEYPFTKPEEETEK